MQNNAITSIPSEEELPSEEWRPTATLQALQARADLLAVIRTFFKNKNILEVETPLMCKRGVTDVNIQTIPVLYNSSNNREKNLGHTQTATLENSKFSHYLQTSPEFAMKRLLAAGVGSIYQICKAFRDEGHGRFHNPEFTVLEWYRVGFDHHQLMDEVEDFLTTTLGIEKAHRYSYQALFKHYLGIDPHTISHKALQSFAEKQFSLSEKILTSELTKDDWLDLCMTHTIEPQLTGNYPVIIYDYPASQAALAKIREDSNGHLVAERFEVYVEGIELANGYHELSDPEVQSQRFHQDNEQRKQRNLPVMEPDLRLTAALSSGFPACAGVALGIDRLLMLKMKRNNLTTSMNIKDVLSFTIENA